MRDELNKTKATKEESIVINLDVSSGPGIHWMCLSTKNDVSYYFDSYGLAPPVEVLDYCKSKERYFAEYPIQQDDEIEILCGHYCVYVLYKLNNGCKFGEILKELKECGTLNKVFENN
jgi:hypothetical protein